MSLKGQQLWISWLSCRQGCFQNKGTQSICKSSRIYESLIRLTQTAKLRCISFEFSLPPGLVYKKYAHIVLEVESMNDNNTQSCCSPECILVLNASKHFPFSYTGCSCTSIIKYLLFITNSVVREQHNLALPHFLLLLALDGIFCSKLRGYWFGRQTGILHNLLLEGVHPCF